MVFMYRRTDSQSLHYIHIKCSGYIIISYKTTVSSRYLLIRTYTMMIIERSCLNTIYGELY